MGLRKRNFITQNLIDGKYGKRLSAIFQPIVPEELILLEPGKAKVGIIEKGIGNSCIMKCPGQGWLPHPLSQPHTARGAGKVLLYKTIHNFNLIALILIRYNRKNRLVIGATDNLNLLLLDHLHQLIDKFLAVFSNPVIEGAAQMHVAPYARVLLEYLDKGSITLIVGLFKDMGKVTHRLMIVNAKKKV